MSPPTAVMDAKAKSSGHHHGVDLAAHGLSISHSCFRRCLRAVGHVKTSTTIYKPHDYRLGNDLTSH